MSSLTWSASEAHRQAQLEVAQLVSAAAGGDERAWHDLFGRFSSIVASVTHAHRLHPPDAADVSQTTWLRFLENLHHLHHPSRAGAWLATTARHECLRVLRRAGRERPTGEATDLDRPDHAAPIEEALLEAERTALFWQAFAYLPQRSQELLRLLMQEPSLSYEQISEAIGIPIGSIGPTRARCVDKLRRRIEDLEREQARAA